MAINLMLIKVLIAGMLFGALFFVKEKSRQILALILTAYLMLIGAEVI